MVNIRIAQPEDADAIELLTRLLIGERKETYDSKRFEWGILRRIMDPFQRQGIFLAETDEGDALPKKVVGMIFSELRVDPFGHFEGYIKQFYVRSKSRHQGIGTALLNAVLEHLKTMNVQIVKVNVKSGSEESFRTYSKQDFQPKYTVMELNLMPEAPETRLSDDDEIQIPVEDSSEDENTDEN
jgi:ribosomal protein S18 acetylase RimI-like enzyme